MAVQPLAPVSYEAIKAVRTLGSAAAFPQMSRQLEAATQTFSYGVPMRLVAGYLQECSFVAADTVYGVSTEKAHNLTVAGTAQDLNDAGPPPNQPSAVITPAGAAIRDGMMGYYAANGLSVFSIALKLGQVFTQGLIVPGTLYGLTKDATSTFWFLDTTVTGGNSAVASLIGVDGTCPNSATYGCRVFFQFAAARRAF